MGTLIHLCNKELIMYYLYQSISFNISKEACVARSIF